MRASGGVKSERKEGEQEEEIVSLFLGAPVHRPVLSVGPEPGPLRRRPAAANSESSSSQLPESSNLPLFPVFCYLRLNVEEKENWVVQKNKKA